MFLTPCTSARTQTCLLNQTTGTKSKPSDEDIGSNNFNVYQWRKKKTAYQASLRLDGVYLGLIWRDIEDPPLDLISEEHKPHVTTSKRPHTGKCHMGGLNFRDDPKKWWSPKSKSERKTHWTMMVRTTHTHGCRATWGYAPSSRLDYVFCFILFVLCYLFRFA